MIDAVFLIDSSLSVRQLCPLDAPSPSADNWQLVLNFVSEVCGKFLSGIAAEFSFTASVSVSPRSVTGLPMSVDIISCYLYSPLGMIVERAIYFTRV